MDKCGDKQTWATTFPGEAGPWRLCLTPAALILETMSFPRALLWVPFVHVFVIFMDDLSIVNLLHKFDAKVLFQVAKQTEDVMCA